MLQAKNETESVVTYSVDEKQAVEHIQLCCFQVFFLNPFESFAMRRAANWTEIPSHGS